MNRHSLVSLVFSCWLAVFALGCAQQQQTAPDTRSADEAALRDADTRWSAVVAAKELDQSVAYHADDAVVLPPNAPLARGKDNIRKIYEEMFATPGFSIGWQVATVNVARSGDLGYTQGSYDLTMNDPGGNPVKDHGKYLTVWKKQPDGSWKSVADMFNSDVAPPPPPK